MTTLNEYGFEFTLAHVNTCLPDYFSGDSRPHIQVPVYKDMPAEALRDALNFELNTGYIGGNSSLFNYDSSSDDDITYAIHEALKVAIDSMIIKDSVLFSDLEEQDDEYCDSVYAYFIIQVDSGMDFLE